MCTHSYWYFPIFLLHIFTSVGPADGDVQTTQSLILSQTVRRVREATSRMGSEHKDLHSAVSKSGKAIDRVNINGLQLRTFVFFIPVRDFLFCVCEVKHNI